MLIYQLVKRFLYSLLLIFLLIHCNPRNKWHSTTVLYFDTLCEINVRCSQEEFTNAIELVKGVFTKIESTFSPQSHDYKSTLFFELLEKSIEVSKASYGAFDVTIGPLTKIWGFQDKNYRIPDKKEIEEALKKVGFKRIIDNKGKISIPSCVEFDWGGIAKGFGVDLACMELKKIGIKNGFINAGGDVYCWGKNPEKRLWRIGIKHPRREGFLGVVVASNVGIATSGDYQRYFEVNGIRYHHILNPYTGYPAKGKQSVTVIGPKTVFCDALATALFVSSEEEKILKKFPEYGAIIVNSQGKISIIGKNYPFFSLN